jgi:hypothetical protein
MDSLASGGGEQSISGGVRWSAVETGLTADGGRRAAGEMATIKVGHQRWLEFVANLEPA